MKLLRKIKDQSTPGARTTIASADLMISKTKNSISNKCAEDFVDTAAKILMAVVIGSLVLGGFYSLFGEAVLPTLTERIKKKM